MSDSIKRNIEMAVENDYKTASSNAGNGATLHNPHAEAAEQRTPPSSEHVTR